MVQKRGVEMLNGRAFDALVVGGGVNGAACAQHLSAAGYSVLLIEKNDFASGSSSRSSRSLGNGMHYLALGHSPWDVLRRPRHFLAGCGMARSALQNRAQFVQETPDRLAQTDFVFPIIDGEAYRAWHFDVGVAMLRLLGTGGQKLNYRRVSGKKGRNMPIVEWMREPEKISSVVVMDHFLFRSPERIVIDTVLDAERLGATALNYVTLAGLEQSPGAGWSATIADNATVSGARVAKARVNCRMVFNMSGIWIDEVNGFAPRHVPQLIAGTKGVHVMLRLPEKCRNKSCTWYNRRNEHMYILPWGDLHYLGPTETTYEGNIDDIRPTEADVGWIIDEANYWMPGMGLRREHVIFAWAGVRPLTKTRDSRGIRRRILHDLGAQGMAGLYCLTGGPLNSQRSAGQDAVEAAMAYSAPTGPQGQPSYSAKLPPDGRTWQRLENFVPAASVVEARNAANEAGPRNLVDLMFRRLHLGWSADMGLAEAPFIAKAAADTLGWDDARIKQEVAAYTDYLATMHLYDVSGGQPPTVGSEG